jgi:hypothetical protein
LPLWPHCKHSCQQFGPCTDAFPLEVQSFGHPVRDCLVDLFDIVELKAALSRPLPEAAVAVAVAVAAAADAAAGAATAAAAVAGAGVGSSAGTVAAAAAAAVAVAVAVAGAGAGAGARDTLPFRNWQHPPFRNTGSQKGRAYKPL